MALCRRQRRGPGGLRAGAQGLLFFAGGWFQALGSALCVLSVLAVLRLSGSMATFKLVFGAGTAETAAEALGLTD